jgi:hypothetical protein
MRFLLATLLLLLLFADLLLCYRGLTTGDTLLYSWPRNSGFHFLQLWTARGGLRLMHGEEFTPPQAGPQLLSWNPGLQHGDYSGPSYPYDNSSEGKSHHFLGFEFWRLDSSYPHLDRHFKSITFPHALVIVFLALYPLRFARNLHRTRLRRKRGAAGLCIRCGYDLQGAAHDRCPECGADVPRNLQLT